MEENEMSEKKDKYIEKFKLLNKAYKLIKEGLSLVKQAFPRDAEIDYFYWKINKVNDKMSSVIYKKIESRYVNEEWKNMVKRLKEK